MSRDVKVAGCGLEVAFLTVDFCRWVNMYLNDVKPLLKNAYEAIC